MALSKLPKDLGLYPPARHAGRINAVQEHIGWAISFHSEVLDALKAQWNTLLPCSTLPIEILSVIFVLACQLQRLESLSKENILTALWISHVCRHWRACAQSTFGLWTTIVPCGENLAGHYLALSRPAALNLTCKRPEQTTKHAQSVKRALRELGRIETLILATDSEFLLEVDELLEVPAPLLESVVLRRTTDEWAIPNPYRLPAHLFQGQSPRLRRVELRGCVGRWDSPMFHRLVHLEIRDLPDSSRLSLAQLRALALASLDLEHLVLLRSVLVAADEESSAMDFPPVELKALRICELSGTSGYHLNLVLHAISTPSLVDLALRIDRPQASSHLVALTPALRRFLGDSSIAFEELEIQATLPGLVRVQLSTGSRLPSRTLSVTHLRHNSDVLRTINALAPFVRMEYVTTFVLWALDPYYLTEDEWRAIDHAVPRLKTIQIRWGRLGTFLTVFNGQYATPNAQQGEADPRISFANVDSIVVVGVQIDSALMLMALREVLRARADLGYRLSTLVFHDCEYDAKEEFAAFKPHVGNLEVKKAGVDEMLDWTSTGIAGDSSVVGEVAWDGDFEDEAPDAPGVSSSLE